jgi:hypothetical protein
MSNTTTATTEDRVFVTDQPMESEPGVYIWHRLDDETLPEFNGRAYYCTTARDAMVAASNALESEDSIDVAGWAQGPDPFTWGLYTATDMIESPDGPGTCDPVAWIVRLAGPGELVEPLSPEVLAWATSPEVLTEVFGDES